MLTLSEPPQDMSKDRTISVRPDSCRRPPHTTAGFELSFLGAHLRQRKQECSHARVSAETVTQLLTQCQNCAKLAAAERFYTPNCTWVYQLRGRLLKRLRAPLFSNCVKAGQGYLDGLITKVPNYKRFKHPCRSPNLRLAHLLHQVSFNIISSHHHVSVPSHPSSHCSMPVYGNLKICFCRICVQLIVSLHFYWCPAATCSVKVLLKVTGYR